MISVASMSMTSQPARVFPAMTSHGKPEGVSWISFHTCARILARACAILASVLASARPRARRTVAPLGAAPSTGASWASTAISLMLVAPSAIAIAIDTTTMPRLSCGNVPARASATSRAAVSPHWSASFRSRTPPPCPASPAPSSVTFRPWSQPLCCMAKSAPAPGIATCGYRVISQDQGALRR